MTTKTSTTTTSFMTTHHIKPHHPRRMASDAWNRLKPAPTDPLEAMGLPSKGDTRLNDFKAQESYYAAITKRYVKFCADAGSRDELERQFASLSLSQPNTPARPHLPRTHLDGASESLPTSKSSTSDLATLLSAMRKLRESLVSTSRTDLFAQRAYVFTIRAAILARAFESYHPALLHLLRVVHRFTPLSAPELREFVGYAVLDAACRLRDLAGAYALRAEWRCADRSVDRVLRALVHDDWVAYWRVRRAVDGHQRCLMEWADERVGRAALRCLARTYFTAEREFVERAAGVEWEGLVGRWEVGWLLEGERVLIRRQRGKS